MPNYRGKNGYGEKKYPPQDVLRESLLRYRREGLTREEKLRRLFVDHELKIGKEKLRQLENEHGIPSVRKTKMPTEIATEIVVNEAAKDFNQRNGPDFIKSTLKDQGILLSRDFVSEVMHAHYPEGFFHRFPGPFHEIACDGHEKLSSLALRIGEVGLPIYGFKDKYSDNLLMLVTIPNCRTAAAIGHLYLDFIEREMAIPLQLTSDRGSETGLMCAIQIALRQTFAPNVDGDMFPEYMFLKSTNNTTIEAFWSWLKPKLDENIKAHILRGAEDGIFDPSSSIHRDLFNWMFPPLVQTELNAFRTYWNQHRVRPQKNKLLPSGQVPADALVTAHLTGALDCRVRITQEAVDILRNFITESVGPRSEHLSWVSEAFDRLASDIYTDLGSPLLTLTTSWTVFARMAPIIRDRLTYV